MPEREDMQNDIKRLREEVSELRRVVNLLIGLMMEEDEEFPGDDDRDTDISSLYN